MRGFLTALLLCIFAGALFFNSGRSSLLTDGSVIAPMMAEAMAEAGTGGAAHAVMR